MVFPLLRVDSSICVLPVLAKYGDRASSTAVLNSGFCNVKNKTYYVAGSLGRCLVVGGGGWVGDIH